MAHDLFFEEAVSIADRYVQDAIHAKDTCTWVNRALPETQAQSWRRPLARSSGGKIFDGTAGIGLFLGRLAAHSDDAAHKRTARAALRHAVRQAGAGLAEGATNIEYPHRFGFYSGALGVAWAAEELADPLDAPDLHKHARTLVQALARTAKEPRAEDLIFGTAGALPTLVDLDARGVKRSLELARALGDDLLASAVERGDAWSWKPMRPEWKAFLTGFSHGASGFAFGLTRLHEATGEEKYREAALGALAYERRAYLASAANWPDFRTAEPDAPVQRAIVNWCHGAPGIGLARLLVHPTLGDARLIEEARAARATTEADVRERLDRPGSNWMLCHGLAGNIETLWLIEGLLGEPAALERARSFTRQGLSLYGAAARKRWETPFLDWPTGIAGVQERSFMKGLAGIGHHLLRLHAPREVPTLLVPGVRAAASPRKVEAALGVSA